MTGEVSFFELGVKDPAPAREFYGELFGWKMELGPSGQGFHIDSGNIPGGLHGGDEGSGPYLFFKVENIEAAAKRVRELGGEAEFTEHSGPGPAGTFAFCRDNQGSSFGLHQSPA
ncbi:MAG: VOC family protein [Solirubrobacteraceae bacterium]|jgi:predicted enzyme related to lactoylglutathione lyase